MEKEKWMDIWMHVGSPRNVDHWLLIDGAPYYLI